jgi:hypothetical protein
MGKGGTLREMLTPPRGVSATAVLFAPSRDERAALDLGAEHVPYLPLHTGAAHGMHAFSPKGAS